MNARTQAQCTPTCALYRSPFSAENTTGLLGPFCEPFPTGIPDEIWENRFDHRQVYPGQVGTAVWTASAPGVKFPTYALQVPEALTAAADVLEGAMIALVPSQADLQRLAIPGGEPATQLHLMLVYLGDAVNIDQSTRDALIAWAKDLAPTWDSVEADGFAPALFNPDGPDPCLTMLCSGADLAEMHETVLADVSDALELPEQHLPWCAHVRLEYGQISPDVQALTAKIGPITFDRLRLAFGGEVTDVPFGSVGSDTEVAPELPVAEPTPQPAATPVAEAQTAAAAGPIREVWDGPLR